MILEAFISTKLSNSIKNHNTSKENYTDSDDEELKNQAHKEIQESGGSYSSLVCNCYNFIYILDYKYS